MNEVEAITGLVRALLDEVLEECDDGQLVEFNLTPPSELKMTLPCVYLDELHTCCWEYIISEFVTDEDTMKMAKDLLKKALNDEKLNIDADDEGSGSEDEDSGSEDDSQASHDGGERIRFVKDTLVSLLAIFGKDEYLCNVTDLSCPDCTKQILSNETEIRKEIKHKGRMKREMARTALRILGVVKPTDDGGSLDLDTLKTIFKPGSPTLTKDVEIPQKKADKVLDSLYKAWINIETTTKRKIPETESKKAKTK